MSEDTIDNNIPAGETQSLDDYVSHPDRDDNAGVIAEFKEALDATIPKEKEKPKELTEIEKKAMTQGWKPEESFDKSKGKRYISAEEFIERGELFKHIDDQKQELRRLKDSFKQVGEHIDKIKKSSYEKALTELTAQRNLAIQQGNLQAVQMTEQRMAQEYNQFQQEIQQARTEPVPISKPELNDLQRNFMDRNGHWFSTDEKAEHYLENQEMITYAKRKENDLTKDRPDLDDRTKMLLIEKDIQKTYPHRFQNSNRTAPSPVAAPTSTNKGSSSSNKLTERLSPQQRSFGRDLVKLGAYKTLDEYAKDLDAQGAI